MNTYKLKTQLLKIGCITICWTIFSVFQFFTGYSAIVHLNCDLGNIEPIVFFKTALFTGVLAGVIGGSSLVFVWEKWLRSKSYGLALTHMFLSFVLIYLLVAIPNGIYFQSQELGVPFYDLDILKNSINDTFQLNELQSFFTWLIVIMVTLIALQVGDKYGPGVFGSFLMGKYFQPRREERIFMFLDLRSSTTIAEQLGEVRYFNFIKDVFKDVTPAILYAKGEIYQYVGDEIIVSWKMEKGIAQANCINCFFEVQSALLGRTNYYEKNYDGLKPTFKAGLHYGYVMAGEIGVVKRDIAFSGDVLNTTARIQSKCNELGVNILVSEYLLDKLALKDNNFHARAIGEVLLRGKQEKVALYTL